MDRLVLFDIDKTLLVGSTVHYTALKNALSEVYGIKNPPPVKNMQGMSDLKIICETLLQENIDLKTIKSGLDQCMEIMYLKYKNALQKQDLELLEGVKELLENLQRVGIPMGLVTGNMEAIAWLKQMCIRDSCSDALIAFLTSPLLFTILSPKPPKWKYLFNPTFSSFNHAIASICLLYTSHSLVLKCLILPKNCWT